MRLLGLFLRCGRGSNSGRLFRFYFGFVFRFCFGFHFRNGLFFFLFFFGLSLNGRRFFRFLGSLGFCAFFGFFCLFRSYFLVVGVKILLKSSETLRLCEVVKQHVKTVGFKHGTVLILTLSEILCQNVRHIGNFHSEVFCDLAYLIFCHMFFPPVYFLSPPRSPHRLFRQPQRFPYRARLRVPVSSYRCVSFLY